MNTRLKIKLLALFTTIALFALPIAEAISGSWHDVPFWCAWIEPAALLAISIIAVSLAKPSEGTSLPRTPQTQSCRPRSANTSAGPPPSKPLAGRGLNREQGPSGRLHRHPRAARVREDTI